MNELSISPSYIHMLILKARSLIEDEAEISPGSGDDPTDDEDQADLQDGARNGLRGDLQDGEGGDLSREEFIEEIEGLGRAKQDQLVALMWLGRDDGGPEDWPELRELAAQRHETPAAHYLLDHPLMADYWANGLDRLGYGSLLD